MTDEGIEPDPEAAVLVDTAESRVRTITDRVVAPIATDITRAITRNGESALGNLVADANREAGGGDITFMNPGGLRNGLLANRTDHPGLINVDDVYSAQPLSNELLRVTLTGEQILRVLERQFDRPNIESRYQLQVSGLSYAWKPAAPTGQKIVDVRIDGKPLDSQQKYTVVINTFLAEGGDGFSVFTETKTPEVVGNDAESFMGALERIFEGGRRPVGAPELGRRARRSGSD